MTLFRGRYRVESARLRSYDYTTPGAYFITICTAGMRPFFGRIVAGQLQLSRPGEIASQVLYEVASCRPKVRLDEWIVMPDHIHAIIFITGNTTPADLVAGNVTANLLHPGTAATDGRVEKLVSLGTIVGQFKSRCTKQILSEGFLHFAWQERFYDHIVRGEEDLQTIRQYILENPAKWEENKADP